MATFSLLLGFALVKIMIGVAIVWLGVRAGERPEDDDRRADPSAPDDWPPRPDGRRPVHRRRRRAAAPLRGRPDRSPRRERAGDRIHA